MATTYTPNFNLGKQEDFLDKFDMSVITRNMDIIDEEIHKRSTDTENEGKYLGRTETAAAAVLDGAGGNISSQFDQTKSDILSAKNDIAVNRHTLGTQCKNIINNNRTSGTSGGLTITVNEDKSVTFNGTATENVYYWVYGTGVSASSQKELARGKYILTGCPEGGTQETYSLAVGHRQSPTSDRYSGYDIGSGYVLSMDSDTGSVDSLIQIRTGTVVNNLTFYPMLRPADITDDSYEPYKPTLQEQINALVAEIAELKTQITTSTTAE